MSVERCPVLRPGVAQEIVESKQGDSEVTERGGVMLQFFPGGLKNNQLLNATGIKYTILGRGK